MGAGAFFRVVLAGAALLAACPSAGAAERVGVTGGPVIAGPYLNGSRVAWLEDVCAYDACALDDFDEDTSARFERFRQTRRGSKPRLLDSRYFTPPISSGESDSYNVTYLRQIGLSGRWLVRGDTAYGNDVSRSRLAAGPAGERLVTLFRCNEDQAFAPERAELDGAHLAYVNPCSPLPRPLRVRNLASGAERRIAPEVGYALSPQAIRGRYLVALKRPPSLGATQPASSLQLLDWTTGRVIAEIPLAQGQLPLSVQLQSDGRFAASFFTGKASEYDRCLYQLAVFAPPAYQRTDLVSNACSGQFDFNGGLLTFHATGPGRTSLLVRLRPGGPRQSVADFGGKARDTPMFDTDSKHVVFARQRCDYRADLIRLRQGEQRYSLAFGEVCCPSRSPGRAG